ncbi:DUF4180 domain-containing protein [Chitinophaga qingshengii]|uniref:DUF4180 domain-containing protein n=1 Tax=Chitinophaga qingshengii TaxID=1569794 RepID=A0ABR7TVZ9_9BACT|nr:DUF4180 domain-containing protein [Chitinophaga qingshengii]MBC9934173.1 DUF4180 domain-containing protein [Chitinophaga qingshengii]
MTLAIHETGAVRIAEVVADDILINTPEEALQLIVDVYYQNFEKMIIHEKNIIPAFFDLKTGIAGEVLQKFVNYRMQLSIVGTFEHYTSKSIRDFIYESNKGRQISFLSSVEEAVEKLSGI